MTPRPVELDEASDPGLRSQIQGILRLYNTEKWVSSPDSRPLTARAMGPEGELLGGCIADTYWGWLVIDVLAVEQHARGQGLGTRLVDAVEAEARSRGCRRAHTSAYAFQGLNFWAKRGYRVVGELSDYPDGHTLYWLRSDL